MSEEIPTGFVGVYHADGGLIGEVRYVVGHLTGRTSCALCEITHTWRRKPDWDAMTARLGVPFELRHLNELDAEQTQAVARDGSPAVFARTTSGLRLVLDQADLDAVGGSVPDFERALRAAAPLPD